MFINVETKEANGHHVYFYEDIVGFDFNLDKAAVYFWRTDTIVTSLNGVEYLRVSHIHNDKTIYVWSKAQLR